MIYSHFTGPGKELGTGPGWVGSNHKEQDPLFPIVPDPFPVPALCSVDKPLGGITLRLPRPSISITKLVSFIYLISFRFPKFCLFVFFFASDGSPNITRQTNYVMTVSYYMFTYIMNKSWMGTITWTWTWSHNRSKCQEMCPDNPIRMWNFLYRTGVAFWFAQYSTTLLCANANTGPIYVCPSGCTVHAK